MYTGQLQKMGILKDCKAPETPAATKRKSLQADLANLGPIKAGGSVGFLNFREEAKPRKGKKTEDDMDSDDDDTDNPILGKADEEESKDDDRFLSPDDIKRQGELAESMRKIRVSTTPTMHEFVANNYIAQASTFCRTTWRQCRGFYRYPGFWIRIYAPSRTLNNTAQGHRYRTSAFRLSTRRGIVRWALWQSVEEATCQCLDSR
jgi:hypothetical protein